MKEKLEHILSNAMSQIEQSGELDKLNEIRVAFLGKKGELTSVLKSMKDVAPEDRPKVGQMVNEARAKIESSLEEKKAAFERKLREEKMKAEVIDVTLPGRERKMGHRHPNTIALEEVEKIFIGMGYEVVEGPEVEYDYYNFEALNIPANHPAKDEQDTFYINDKIVLRTQTSSVQVHEMEKGKLPIRMISPGRVFRSDDVDATHSPSFHQIEGLVIDKNITFADLKGTLEQFAKKLFGEDTKVKFRPHHFPFTEPSAEMDVTCFKCGGKGCRFCKGEGWIEILGCGMNKIKTVRKSGLTFAPEAGSQRMRDVINKNVREDELLQTCTTAFAGGWTTVKLYFMIGLPTETMDDVAAIAGLGQSVVDAYYKCPDKPKGKSVRVTVSASSFVPKPFTPFQWEPQDTIPVLHEKQQHIKDSITTRKIQFNYHDADTSYLEAVFARGDRKLCKVMELACERGFHFDGWNDCFSLEKWLELFDECGVDPSFYANRHRSFDEILPWDHIDYGVTKDFLIRECKKAYADTTTPHCRLKCNNCGAAKYGKGVCFEKRKNMV